MFGLAFPSLKPIISLNCLLISITILSAVRPTAFNVKAAIIKGGLIPRAIDELPVVMVAATQAKGTTKIIGAKELRIKETDRIKSMSEGLNKMGANIKLIGDDIYIKGPTKLKAASLKSMGDHSTAMSFAVAGLITDGQTTIEDTKCILTSFPDFKKTLSKISKY